MLKPLYAHSHYTDIRRAKRPVLLCEQDIQEGAQTSSISGTFSAVTGEASVSDALLIRVTNGIAFCLHCFQAVCRCCKLRTFDCAVLLLEKILTPGRGTSVVSSCNGRMTRFWKDDHCLGADVVATIIESPILSDHILTSFLFESHPSRIVRLSWARDFRNLDNFLFI